MQISTRLFRLAVLGGVVSACALALSAPAHSQPLLDHFKIYDLQTPMVGGSVTLRDQFGVSSVQFQGPRRFGLPTSKNNEGIHNGRDHLTWYDIFEPPQPTRRVVIENQFGEATIEVQGSRFLLVPALKNPVPGQPHEPAINHFKCYDAFGEPADRTVTLDTQFGHENVHVGPPRFLCNPAEKQTNDGQVFPILNPRDHLVCYIIDPRQPIGVSITYRDQFIQANGHLRDNLFLCLPSLKTGVTDSESPSWGRMKSMYR